METIEYRVRPVVRHIVTQSKHDPEARTGSVGPVGEFQNEQQAEAVKEALDFQVAPRQYVAVLRGFELATEAAYFESEQEASQFCAQKQAQYDQEWRVFSRVVTDPIARARILMGVLHNAPPTEGVNPMSLSKSRVESAG